MFPALLFTGAQPLVAGALSTDFSEISHPWLHQIQSDEPLPREQRDVLEQLLDTPAAADLKAVFELYLNRNRKLTDKDFETFSKILKTVRELEELEGQQETETQEAEERPDDDQEQLSKTEPTPSTPPAKPSVEADRSALPEKDDQPSAPTVDLDFLYHDARPMRPL
jgi:hypothetical protein